MDIRNGQTIAFLKFEDAVIVTVTITVIGVNDNPTFQSGTGDATEDGTAVDIDLSVLGNDLDSDDNGTTLTYAIVGTPVGEGSATINGTTLTFDPGADFQNLALNETREVVVQVQTTESS